MCACGVYCMYVYPRERDPSPVSLLQLSFSLTFFFLTWFGGLRAGLLVQSGLRLTAENSRDGGWRAWGCCAHRQWLCESTCIAANDLCGIRTHSGVAHLKPTDDKLLQAVEQLTLTASSPLGEVYHIVYSIVYSIVLYYSILILISLERKTFPASKLLASQNKIVACSISSSTTDITPEIIILLSSILGTIQSQCERCPIFS